MALPFFRALNPTSVNSGINYTVGFRPGCNDMEMIDDFVTDAMYKAIYLDKDLISLVDSSYTIAIGCHYDFDMKGRHDARGGTKGILDYLIFPLIARKLIANQFLPENENNFFSSFLFLTVGIPLEISRLLIGAILTIVICPFVLFMNRIQACIYFYNEYFASQTNAEKIMHIKDIDIPNEYKCPVSMEIMTDPVEILDSKSKARFEKSYIFNLMRANNSIYCFHPLTRERLDFRQIKNDLVLKEQIEEYVNQLLKQEQEQHKTHMPK